MFSPTRLVVSGAASLLGIALAAGGALLGTGSLTTADAPGQVLKVSGVGTAAHATARPIPRATAHATPHATETPHNNVGQVSPPAAQSLPAQRGVVPTPMPSPHPVVPQPGHHSPEPVHHSPDTHMTGHSME